MAAKKIQSTWTRVAELDRAAVDAEKRTLEISFSSEYPVERFFGVEILDHSEGCCDLSRLNSGAPLLVNHDMEKQCGVIESAAIKDKRGIATVRFGNSQFADEIFRDVKDGIRRLVSVGYRLTDTGKVVREESDGPEVYRFQSWQPYEISIVPVPADPTVGTDRAGTQPTTIADFELPPMKRNLLLDPAPSDGGGNNHSPELVAQRERERATELLKVGAKFRSRISEAVDMANSAVESGMSVADFNRSLLDKVGNQPIANAQQPVLATQDDHRSFGEALANAPAFREFIKANKGNLKTRRFSQTFDLPNFNTRATLTTTVAGLTKYERPPGIVLVEQQVLQAAQLFAQGTTENTTVRYMREDTYTNGAATRLEEGQYAEASWDLSEQDAGIKSIGVIGRITEEIMEDSAAVASYINARLPFMVQEREEIQLLNGDGTGSSLTGVFNTSGIQTLAAGASSSVMDAIHKAITKVRVVGRFQPDAVLLNPYDWENLKLARDNNGQYLAGGPFSGAYGVGGYVNVMSLWGLPCVASTNVTQGTALVGAFNLGAQVWRRKGVTVETTNSDASDFAYGRIAIRVTERVGLAVYRPTAFCAVTGIPAV